MRVKLVVMMCIFFIGMLPIVSAPAPSAQTLPAQDITQTSVILVGRVNPNGLSTIVDFCSCDSSGSPSYFSPTPVKNIGDGNAAVTVTQALAGLTPGTEYHYAIRSSNAAGSQNGSCVTFTTLSAGVAHAMLTTNKLVYSLGEQVFFTLTNTGAVPITCNNVNPWNIYKQVGASWQIAYVPAAMLVNWTINPGESKGWSWGQTSNAMVPIDAGTYKVEVNITGVGTWSTTFAIGGGAGTGSLKIECSVSGYDVFIDNAFVTTASSANVTIHDVAVGIHEVKLTKTDCETVVETVTVIAGTTTTLHATMTCGEKDDDGDGIPNSDDKCYNPGCAAVDAKGCPKDTDGDGIADCEDDCPAEKGNAANQGCPAAASQDKDNDGVSDDKDGCFNPDCSIVDAQGCPKDTDGDGLEDCKDECPSEEGEKRNGGCPVRDADNDGINDDQDSCYNPGCNQVDSRGCPYDSDGDGLNDCQDNCPSESGPRSNNGCPKGFCLGSVFICLLIGALAFKR